MFVRLHRSCTIRGYIDISCRGSDLLDVQEVLAALVGMLDDVLADGDSNGAHLYRANGRRPTILQDVSL